MTQRITWNLVRNTLIRELQGAAERAGLDTADWRLDDGPWPDLVAGGKRWNDGWALASECARYLRGWTDALSCVAAAREAAAEDQHPSPQENSSGLPETR